MLQGRAFFGERIVADDFDGAVVLSDPHHDAGAIGRIGAERSKAILIRVPQNELSSVGIMDMPDVW